MRVKKALFVVFDFCVLFLIVLFSLRPDITSAFSASGIDFCIKTLLPSLFVYAVLSRLLMSSPVVSRAFAGKYGGALILFSALLCGYPFGVKNTMILYENGVIGKEKAQYYSSFANCASVSFLYGFAGISLNNDKALGIKLILIQLFAALLTALVMRFVLPKGEMCEQPVYIPQNRRGTAFAVSDGVRTMAQVCGSVVLLGTIAEFFCRLFEISGIQKALICSVFELTAGLRASAELPFNAKLFVMSAAVGFSGLAVLLQTSAVTKNKISILYCAAGKIMTAAFAFVISVIIT